MVTVIGANFHHTHGVVAVRSAASSPGVVAAMRKKKEEWKLRWAFHNGEFSRHFPSSPLTALFLRVTSSICYRLYLAT